MIVDIAENLKLYREIPELQEVTDYIAGHDLRALPDGTTEIRGRDLYVMIQHCTLKDAADAYPEAHDKYIDLQFVLEGEEYMGVLPRTCCSDLLEAHPENDICFYREKNYSKVKVSKDMFAVFFPGDCHAPCIRTEAASQSVKAVFKIRIKGV